jgi:hypothetical protein
MSARTPEAYLAYVDSVVGLVSSPAKKAAIIEGGIEWADRMERELAEWAACGSPDQKRPTPLNAFDLSRISVAMAARLSAVRGQMKETTP